MICMVSVSAKVESTVTIVIYPEVEINSDEPKFIGVKVRITGPQIPALSSVTLICWVSDGVPMMYVMSSTGLLKVKLVESQGSITWIFKPCSVLISG